MSLVWGRWVVWWAPATGSEVEVPWKAAGQWEQVVEVASEYPFRSSLWGWFVLQNVRLRIHDGWNGNTCRDTHKCTQPRNVNHPQAMLWLESICSRWATGVVNGRWNDIPFPWIWCLEYLYGMFSRYLPRPCHMIPVRDQHLRSHLRSLRGMESLWYHPSATVPWAAPHACNFVDSCDTLEM